MSKSRRVRKETPGEKITRSKIDSKSIKINWTIFAFVSHAKFIAVLKALLMTLVIVISISTIRILLIVDIEFIGQVIGLAANIVLIITAITPLFKPEVLQRYFRPLAGSLLASNTISTVLLIVVLIFTICFRWILFDGLGGKKIESAFISVGNNKYQAENDLKDAKILGIDITDKLSSALQKSIDETAGPENDARTKNLAQLTSMFAEQERRPDITIEALTKFLIDKLNYKVDMSEKINFYRVIESLSIINPSICTQLAEKYNDEASSILNDSRQEREKAWFYIEAAQEFNVCGKRDAGARSIALYQLAQFYQRANRLDEAVITYNEAIGLDAQNLAAYYALSASLMDQYERDASNAFKLMDASSNASLGLKQIVNVKLPNANFCQEKQNLQDEKIREESWMCFLLMTVKGAALVELGDYDEAIPFLISAMKFAEGNEYFKLIMNYDPEAPMSTAEPYYYYARTQETPDSDILCNIITHRGTKTPRHDQWVRFANDKLKEQGMSCKK
jgi:tetratricopeptide (TPR) repeat protein